MDIALASPEAERKLNQHNSVYLATESVPLSTYEKALRAARASLHDVQSDAATPACWTWEQDTSNARGSVPLPLLCIAHAAYCLACKLSSAVFDADCSAAHGSASVRADACSSKCGLVR